MGLDNRDYVREERRWTGGGGGLGGANGQVTKQIVIATGVVFLAQMLTIQAPGGGVTGWLLLDWLALTSGQVWRLLTYAFCHDTRQLQHILFNMLVLWFAGRAVEAIVGPAEFLRFYLCAAVAAAIAYVGIGLAMRGVNPMLGASGATMAVFAVFAMTYPRAKVYIMGIIPVEARWLLVAYVVFDMLPVVSGRTDGVAHAAHLGGLAFGMWYKFSGTNIGSWFGAFSGSGSSKPTKKPRANPDVRIYEPTPDELEARVDELLEKIQREGEASLTDAEREFLKEASRQYRRR